MTLWVFLLRIVGFLLSIGMIVDFLYFVQTDFASTPRFLAGQLIHNAEQLAVALVCFGVAAGLRQVRQTDERITRAAAARRRTGQQPRNLAPDAPVPTATTRYMDEGERIRHSGGRALRRIDKEYINRKYSYRVPDPQVRATPSPSRITPGTEDQYTADTLPIRAYRPPPSPMPRALPRPDVESQRNVLREGRDAQLRRMQAEQSRKQKPRL